MKKLLTQHQRTFGILIHCISWFIIFIFPFLLTSRGEDAFSWGRYLHHSMVPIVFMVLFYSNYFLLVPKYLFNEQPYKFILQNVLLVMFLAMFLHFWQGLFTPPEMNHLPKRPLPPRWLFFTRDVLGMVFAVGLSAIIRISGRWVKLEAARREAEKNRTEAELKNLRNQLNPHFLLNTLNNIYALIAFDSEKAQQAVQELSKLLRYMLYDNQKMFVPLIKEADFIKNYIELMRIRLSNNVTLETDIRIEKENQTPIASLLFISLIENAFKHGISSTEASYIRISLTEKEGTVVCEIVNSNFPKGDKDKSGSGIGLAQASKRLELLYPGNYSWEKGLRKEGKEYFSHLQIQTVQNQPL